MGHWQGHCAGAGNVDSGFAPPPTPPHNIAGAMSVGSHCQVPATLRGGGHVTPRQRLPTEPSSRSAGAGGFEHDLMFIERAPWAGRAEPPTAHDGDAVTDAQ